MQDRKLITITVVADDDTGIYGVGDMDYSMPYATKEWVAIPENRKKLADWLDELARACRDAEPPFDLQSTGGDSAAKSSHRKMPCAPKPMRWGTADMGTMRGWETRRRTKQEQEEFIIAKAYRHGYEEGRQSLADLLGQLQAIAVTAERLCRYDGSRTMSQHGHFYDAAKAYEYSERLHELLDEWRKGQKEGRWTEEESRGLDLK